MKQYDTLFSDLEQSIPELKTAFISHQQGQLLSAENAYLNILQTMPNHALTHHLLGMLHLQKNHIQQSLYHLKQAVLINPHHAIFELNLGIAYKRLNQFSEAMTHLRNALSLFPECVPAYLNLANIYLELKEYQQAEKIYEQALMLDSHYAPLHNQLGHCYYEQGAYLKAHAHFEKALQIIPKYAGAHNNIGLNYNALNQPEKALAHFQHAITLQPTLIEAQYNLANTYNALERYELAIPHWQTILKHVPQHALALFELANAHSALGHHETAIPLYEKAVGIEPTFPLAWLNLGNALQLMRYFEKAHQAYQQACYCDPQLAQAHFYKSTIHLLQKQFKAGWQEYEWRLKLSSYEQPTRLPRWNGQPIKHLLIIAEQGYGDTIQFIRFIPLIRHLAQQITLAVQPELMRLFESLKDTWNISIISKNMIETENNVNAFIHLMSLPYLLEYHSSSFPLPPSLSFNPSLFNSALTLKPSSILKIGICWQGNPLKQDQRAIPLKQLQSLFENHSVEWYLLSPHTDSVQKETILSKNSKIIDLSADLQDFADTAYLISQLDVVISIDTAVAHLAGTMNKKLWLLLPYAADWRWFEDMTSPWYPSATLVRQTKRACWDSVINCLQQYLNTLISNNASY